MTFPRTSACTCAVTTSSVHDVSSFFMIFVIFCAFTLIYIIAPERYFVKWFYARRKRKIEKESVFTLLFIVMRERTHNPI